jgi:pyruvate dehydrogenase E1 component alpha subunit
MDPAEKTAAMEADPVPRFRAKLLADSIASEASLKVIEDAIEEALDEAVEFAVSSPFPPVGELTLDIYQHEVAA